MTQNWVNKLYFGDNLKILREYVENESVDLIYLDPPFNSKATYNVLFDEKNGTRSEAQIKAFDDTWHWSQESEQTFYETVTTAPTPLALVLESFQQFLGRNDMMAYLTMMAPRLLELHKVLKKTGSIYLHCVTASHYLKILMDSIFGIKNFQNEVIWYYGPKATQRSISFQRKHDIIGNAGLKVYQDHRSKSIPS